MSLASTQNAVITRWAEKIMRGSKYLMNKFLFQWTVENSRGLRASIAVSSRGVRKKRKGFVVTWELLLLYRII
jgi:hypothetical protein